MTVGPDGKRLAEAMAERGGWARRDRMQAWLVAHQEAYAAALSWWR